VITAIVLAAGRATRMGRQKLLLPYGESTVVRESVRRVLDASVDEVIIVVGGPDADAIASEVAAPNVRVALNPDPDLGLGGSLRAGMEALHERTRAVIVALGDQPTVPSIVSTALWETWTDTHRPIVVARYNGVRGNPVLFAASVFDELREVQGDVGARDVIARDPERVAYVDWPIDPPRDIDTPEDYQELHGPLPPDPAGRADAPGPTRGDRPG